MEYANTVQHQEANQQFHNAVRFVPDFAEAYHSMYQSYTALDQPAYVAYARGMEAFSLQDYGVAKTHLESAQAELPEYVPLYIGLGLVYEQLGDLGAAVISLEHALELEPDNFLARNTLGRIQLALEADNNS